MNLTETQQIEFLLNLGKRLEAWTRPEDENDFLTGDHRLWDQVAVKTLPTPARVIDVLLQRWIRIKDFRFPTRRPVRFTLNAAQQHFSANRAAKNVILKAGKAGFTTYVAQRGFLRTITQPGHTALLVAQDKDSAQDFFDQVRLALREIPEPLGSLLRAGALRTDKASVRELKFPALNSRFFVETAGEFAPAEGQSFQYLQADEMARWLKGDPKQVIGTLLSHMTGNDTEVYLLSRPFGQSGEFYERYQQARRGDSDYRAHFYQWWWNGAQSVKAVEPFAVSDEEKALCGRYRAWRAVHSDSGLPAALGKGQIQWRRGQIKELRDLFAQEFAEDEVACFLGSGNCPFSATAIEAILNDQTPILERTTGAGESENGLIRWRDPIEGRAYILFLDPAGGLHTSRTAIEVIDSETGEQVAEWVGRIDFEACAAEARNLGSRYNAARIAVENNLGAASATILQALGDYPNLYRHLGDGRAQLGWPTTATTRPAMLDTLGHILAESPSLFHSRRLAGELKSCVRSGDRIEHGKGATDDLVMAMAGALSVRQRGGWNREPMLECISTAVRDPDWGWQKVGG